jgi:hypothetical protein
MAPVLVMKYIIKRLRVAPYREKSRTVCRKIVLNQNL